MPQQYLILADKIYSLKLLNRLRLNNQIAAIVTSYHSPVLAFSKIHNIPLFNAHQIFNVNDDYQNFKQILNRKVPTLLDLNLQTHTRGEIDKIYDETEKIGSNNYLQLKFGSLQNNKNASANLGFENALIESVSNEKNSRNSMKISYSNHDDFGHVRISTRQDSVDSQDVIKDVGVEIDDLFSNIETYGFRNQNLDNYHATFPPIETDITSNQLTFNPETETSLQLFAKSTAFYGLLPIICHISSLNKSHVMYQEHLDEKLMVKPVFLHAIRLCSDTVNQALSNYCQKFLDYKNSSESENKQIPVGSFITLNSTKELNLPNYYLEKPWSNDNDRTMTSPRKTFIYCKDKKWIQLIAFSNDGSKIMHYRQFSKRIKSDNVPYTHRKFIPVRFPDSVIREEYNIILKNGVRNMGGKMKHGANYMKMNVGLDRQLQKQVSRMVEEQDAKKERKGRENEVFDQFRYF